MTLRTASTIISTILFDLTLIAYGGTYRNGFWYASEGQVWELRSYRGLFGVTKREAWGKSTYVPLAERWQLFGFHISSGYPHGNWSYKYTTALVVPYWFLVLITGFLPMRFIWRIHAERFRARRRVRGFEPIITSQRK